MLKGTARMVTAMVLGAGIGWVWSWVPFLSAYRRPYVDPPTARLIGSVMGAFMGFVCGLAWNALSDHGDSRGR
jgi:hypothetical protein